MVRFTRLLATRLRRIASPTRRAADARAARSLGVRPASADAWARLDHALAAPVVSVAATRRRELAHENVRLSITLVGQQGRGAVRRIVAAGDGKVPEASEAVRVALAVASALGYLA